jgi:hypothetical protein
MEKFEQKQARSAGSGRLWRGHTGSRDGASFWQMPGRISALDPKIDHRRTFGDDF